MKFRYIAILATISAGSVLAQLPTQKVLTIDLAQTIAQEAMLKCRADGYKVSVTVVDHANLLKAFLRDDGAPMATVEIGRMKTNTVMAFGRASGPPANLPAGQPAPPPRCRARLMRWAECRSRSATNSWARCRSAGLLAATRMLPAPTWRWRKWRIS